MQTRRSVRGRLVGSVAVVAAIGALLVIATVASAGTVPPIAQIEPVPVPTPAPVQPAVIRASAAGAQRPAPVATPPGSPVSPQGTAGQIKVLYLFASPALAVAGLAAYRLSRCLPSERPAPAARRETAVRQECGT